VLIVTFARVGTLVKTLENSIATTQRTLWNSKAMPYFRETWILFFWVCGYNKLNKFNEGDLVFADAVRTLCSITPSFTSRLQICDPTSIRWITIENPPISLGISDYFTTTQPISVGLQIWMQQVKEGLKQNNLRIDNVMIQSQLKYLIGAKGVGTVYLELQSNSNPAK
jgi:hypothetical protein